MNSKLATMVCALAACALALFHGGTASATEGRDASKLLSPAQATKAAKSSPVKAEDSGCWKALAATCFRDFLPGSAGATVMKPVPTSVSIFRHDLPAAASKDFDDRIIGIASEGSADGSVSVIAQSPSRITMLVQDPVQQYGWSGSGGLLDGALIVTATCSYGGATSEESLVALSPQQRKAIAACVDSLLTAQMKKVKR